MISMFELTTKRVYSTFLKLLQEDLSIQTFVKRLLGSAEVKAWNEIFPRGGVLDDLSESNQANVVTVMTILP
jgi:hypothetical protein